MEGLEDYLQYALLNLRFDDFNHLVDSALNTDRKSTRLNSSHNGQSRMPSSA